MRALYLIIGALIAVAVSGVVYATHNAPALEDRVATLESFHGIDYSDVEPTATEVPATATAVPPTATEEPSAVNGWHGVDSHDGLNLHEHGDAPPAWVTDLNVDLPRGELHQGYKGALAVSPGGVESYFIAHIISTANARSHGDHDYQLWLRDPDTGDVFYEAGVLCFAEPCGGVPPERTSDTGERPIILSVNDGACETWYSDPGNKIADVGWTICGRYENFAGDVLGGDGTFRTIDWLIPCNRLPGNSPLQNNCVTEFGVPRLSFIVNSVDYGNADPIN